MRIALTTLFKTILATLHAIFLFPCFIFYCVIVSFLSIFFLCFPEAFESKLPASPVDISLNFLKVILLHNQNAVIILQKLNINILVSSDNNLF